MYQVILHIDKDPAENDIPRTDAEYPHLRLFIDYLTVSWVIICVSVYELLYSMLRNQRVNIITLFTR